MRTSEYDSIDKAATWSANCALKSKKKAMTIEDICRETRYRMPVSEDDLRRFWDFCQIWDIRCNIAADLERQYGRVKP